MTAHPAVPPELQALNIEYLRGLERLLELRGKTCSVFEHGKPTPYLVGVIDTVGMTRKHEFVLFVAPRSTQLPDELSPGGFAVLVGKSDHAFRHMTRVATNDAHSIFIDHERSVRIAID